MRLGLQWIINRIIDAVDFASLRPVGIRREREIRVTARFAQYVKFFVDAATPAVGPGIVQCPVAMNERILRLTVIAAAGKQIMLFSQELLPIKKGFSQTGFVVIVVMQMDFNFTETLAAQVGDLVHLSRTIHLDGIEERVPGCSAIGVMEITEKFGVLTDPIFDALIGLLS
jgi:hypothetical protein